MICTRCDGTGFLNIHQLPDGVDHDMESVEKWLKTAGECGVNHDVQPCDCCGDGEGWYGTPGEHYGPDDRQGPTGPYASNGGLCQCH